MRKQLLSEVIGTFILIFCGTGAVVIHQHTGGTPAHIGICATWGLVVMAIIYGFGEISGAHINPAVTIGFAVAGRFPWKNVPGYLIAQVIGGCLASGLLLLVFPENEFLGGTQPSIGTWQAFVVEVTITFILMIVILTVSTGPKEQGMMAGIAIGGTVALLALVTGPVTGASMNPVRSFAPAVVSLHLENLWIYLIGTTLGAILAVGVFRFLHDGEKDV